MKKIVTVLGARPQFIKASVVSSAMRQTGVIRETLIHTGQHFDANMSDVFFDELEMRRPDHALDIHSLPHGAMTGRMLERCESIMLDNRPDLVLVYGDTNSTLAGALAAVKLGIPIAHVEAGLRSFNMAMPEEINRILTDRIADLLFAPTEAAVRHLQHDGISSHKVHLVGDVMYDVALQHGRRSRSDVGLMRDLQLERGRYALITVHRAENTDDVQRLRAVVHGIAKLAGDMTCVWPMHPRTRGILKREGLESALTDAAPNLILCEPLGYFDMVQMEKFAGVVVTDSGGVQKEAFFHGVPCITLRDETEWLELVESGWNTLVPPQDPGAIHRAAVAAVGRVGQPVTPYGTGDAAVQIARRMVDFLNAG